MDKILLIIVSIFFSYPAYADMSSENKSKAWDCSGIYLSNYFLPVGETFEYSMKEKMKLMQKCQLIKNIKIFKNN